MQNYVSWLLCLNVGLRNSFSWRWKLRERKAKDHSRDWEIVLRVDNWPFQQGIDMDGKLERMVAMMLVVNGAESPMRTVLFCSNKESGKL